MAAVTLAAAKGRCSDHGAETCSETTPREAASGYESLPSVHRGVLGCNLILFTWLPPAQLESEKQS